MKIIFLLLLVSTSCVAQITIESISTSYPQKELKRNLYHIASDKMEGRMFASKGDTLVSKFIGSWFKKHGLIAPYNNGKSYFQSVSALQINDQLQLSIGNKQYAELDGWQLYPNEEFNLPRAAVIVARHDNLTSFFADLPNIDLKNKAILFTEKLILPAFSGPIDSLEMVLKQHGALAVIWGSKVVERVVDNRKKRQFLPEYEADKKVSFTSGEVFLPEIALTPVRLKELLEPDQISISENGQITGKGDQLHFELKTLISLSFKKIRKPMNGPNVIGIIRGQDTTAACILVSAHHDHDGKNGKEFFYGAVDNASGTVAMMQMAALAQQAVKSGLKPKRTIVFASWTGEERGLLGSMWYAQNPVVPLTKTHAVLNTDMLGRADTLYSGKRPDSLNYVYVMVKDPAKLGLTSAVEQANEKVKLKLDHHFEEPKYERRMLLGSDQYSFYLRGIPFVYFSCGFSRDYHKITDTADKIDYDLLARQTQLSFLTLWKMANL